MLVIFYPIPPYIRDVYESFSDVCLYISQMLKMYADDVERTCVRLRIAHRSRNPLRFLCVLIELIEESRTSRSDVRGCWVDGECSEHTTAIAPDEVSVP